MERREAERRVDALVGWFGHITVYAAVLTLLATINIATWRGVPWVLFAALGWGIGVVAHGVRVGALRFARLEDWRRAKIDAFMREPS
jgi:two-component system LytT family sensor kinase